MTPSPELLWNDCQQPPLREDIHAIGVHLVASNTRHAYMVDALSWEGLMRRRKNLERQVLTKLSTAR